MLDKQAIERPDRVGVIQSDGRSKTFAQWKEGVDDARANLAAWGVQGGDRVMLIAENCIAFTEYVLAAWHLDAWVMPVNARLTGHEIKKLADHARPALILFTSLVSKPAAVHADKMGAELIGGISVFKTGIRESELCHPNAAEQTAALLYTTGTTGDPKGVMLTHAGFAWYADVSREFRGLSEHDHVYCALPTTHVFGFASAFLGSLNVGAKLQLASRFDPASVFDAISEGVTVLPAVPAMYAQLLDYAELQGWDSPPNSRMRFMTTGGAPLDPDWKERVQKFFKVPLANGYGMTECSPGIAASIDLRLSPETNRDVSCGPPMRDLEVKVVPAPGKSDLVDGIGEILVKGPNVMLGYYKNPDATATAIDPDGYFHTGDLGHFDEHGHLYVDGRSKELIIRSGFNVYPPEVEAALTDHPSVTLAAVVGRKVPGNEEVTAFVQPVPGTTITEQELQEFTANQLVAYKRPSRIVIAETLPAASTGKVLKSQLLEVFSDRF